MTPCQSACGRTCCSSVRRRPLPTRRRSWPRCAKPTGWTASARWTTKCAGLAVTTPPFWPRPANVWPPPPKPGQHWQVVTATNSNPRWTSSAWWGTPCAACTPAAHRWPMRWRKPPKRWPVRGSPRRRHWPWKWPPPCCTCRPRLTNWVRTTCRWPNVPSTWRSACSVCRRVASPSRSKRGWKTCTGVSVTARLWVVWWVNYAPPWAKSKN